jgi:hypothetical protein
VIDERDERAAKFFELEGLRFGGIDVGQINAEIAGGGIFVNQQGMERFQQWRDLLRLNRDGARRQQQSKQRGGAQIAIEELEGPQKAFHG